MKTDYKFGDTIWVSFDKHNDSKAVFVREAFGCALIVHETSSEILRVSFDLIRPREIKRDFDGVWIPMILQRPKHESMYIVSILDDSGDNKFRYTTVGWRPKEFEGTDKWIVDNEVVGNVEAWMPFPKPYN